MSRKLICVRIFIVSKPCDKINTAAVVNSRLFNVAHYVNATIILINPPTLDCYFLYRSMQTFLIYEYLISRYTNEYLNNFMYLYPSDLGPLRGTHMS